VVNGPVDDRGSHLVITEYLPPDRRAAFQSLRTP
jgi:hypothetical protein